MVFLHVKLQPATTEDAESIAALRNAVSDDLTFKHGRGGLKFHVHEYQILGITKRGDGLSGTTRPTKDNLGSLLNVILSKRRRRAGFKSSFATGETGLSSPQPDNKTNEP